MGSGRPDPGSAPAGPALTGLSLAAVGTPAKTHLSWGAHRRHIHQLRKPESGLSLDYRAVLHLPQEGCRSSVSSWSAWVPEQSSCLITPRQSACLTCTRPSICSSASKENASICKPQAHNPSFYQLLFTKCQQPGTGAWQHPLSPCHHLPR